MDYHTLRNMDLNLLIVLDVLLREGSVTHAAKKLGRTQSAVSHALSRLRNTFDDKLLVRVGSNMEPTPRAKGLQKDLQRLLGSLRKFMDDTDTFQPEQTTRTFRLRVPPNLKPVLGPFLTRFSHEAPKASLAIENVDYLRLDSGKGICLSIAPTNLRIPGNLCRTPLCKVSWKAFVRKDHPAVHNWSSEAWKQNKHIKLRIGRITQDMLEKYEQQANMNRTIQMETTQMDTAFEMLMQSNLVLASALHPKIYRDLNITALKVPFSTPDIEFGLIWSEVIDQDSARVWFADLLHSALQDL